MGQRLIVHLIKDNKRVASIYYHWAAYFDSTIDRAAWLSDKILKAEQQNEDVILYITKALCKEGGGISQPDYEYFKAKYPDATWASLGDRDLGLIAFSEENMAYHDAWSEGDLVIKLDSHEIVHNVWLEGEHWLEITQNPNFPNAIVLRPDPNKTTFSIEDKTYDWFKFTCETADIIYKHLSST